MRVNVSGWQAAEVVLPLAQGDPGGQGPDFGKSTPVGLFLLILLLLAVGLLVRSMTKQLRRVPTRFDQQRADAAAPGRVKRAEARAAEERARAEAEAEAGDPEAGSGQNGASNEATREPRPGDEDRPEGKDSTA